ncbi:unnamed protein product, partial [Mesorhabditis belari]|uniref:Uncharacterized protein n=1 Tax=Mesorhabditis belari TaxID=2138241 RepID=A0AAF3EXF1_9BILA
MKRSFDISVNMARRQIVETWKLFLPYSALHAVSFIAYQFLGIAYRSIFVKLLDEVSYAAGTGYIFTPTYFVAISPLLIFWIIHSREKSRLNQSKDLMKKELEANDLYFENYRNQWECPPGKRKQTHQETGHWKFLCNFRQKIYPSNEKV